MNRIRYGKSYSSYMSMFNGIEKGDVVMFYTKRTEDEIKKLFIKYFNTEIKVEFVKEKIFKLTKNEEQEEQQSN